MATDRENILAKIYSSMVQDTSHTAFNLIKLSIVVHQKYDEELGEHIYNEAKQLLIKMKETNIIWSDITKDLLEELEQEDFSDILKRYLGDNLPSN